ncbi:unnamed protein product [Cylicostephanus goldi]|uniref:Uncharacterized protein n=1 Tax=Cylicostephanus goldi TaxID=71465 RepID=A0A3P7MXP3_CYLGO|nr:unnamed protein product [Cylicostephanus goldi]
MLTQHIIRSDVVMVRDFCGNAQFFRYWLKGFGSAIISIRIHSDLEKPFCNGEAKVPSDEGNAALMRQFSELKGSAMVSQDALQTEALNCIDNFDEKDCDSTFALNYTKTTNIKVAASAASHYGERLKKV